MTLNEEIHIIAPLVHTELQPLITASLAEGYPFVQRLWDEYASGKARFDSDGSALFGVYANEILVAVGGIHRDPYLDRATIGRIRHVYVMPEYRRDGVGRRLMEALIGHARKTFDYLTLRTPTAHADAFYVAIGFSREPRFESATHWLELRPS